MILTTDYQFFFIVYLSVRYVVFIYRHHFSSPVRDNNFDYHLNKYGMPRAYNF